MKKLSSHYLQIIFALFCFINITNTKWIKANGIKNEITLSLIAAGENTFAGTWGRGIYISKNHGKNWTAAGLNKLNIISLDTVRDSGRKIYLVAGTKYNGIFISNDCGKSWIKRDKGLKNFTIMSLIPKGNNIFAGTDGGGIFLSTDLGKDWQQINKGLANLHIQSLAIKGTDIYTGTQGGGVYVFHNNGKKWNPLNKGLLNHFVTSLAIVDSDVFAGTYGDGLYIYQNNKNKWIHDGLRKLNIISLSVAKLKNGLMDIYAGTYGSGFYLSHDSGKNWEQINYGLKSYNISSIIKSGQNIIAGTLYGIFYLPMLKTQTINRKY